MTTHSPLFLLAALGVLSTVPLAAAAVDTSEWKCETCPYPKGASGTVEVGVGAVTQDSARFGDFTGLQDKGAYAVAGGSLSQRSESGYYADLIAANLGLSSRSVSGQTGLEGLVRLRFAYAELPRHFADDAFTPFSGSGTGTLTLPAGFPAGGTAAMPLADTLQPVKLGYKRKRYDLAGQWTGFRDWTYRVTVRRDTRDGTQPRSASFFASATQLAAPVDQTTDQLEVAASYAHRGLQASVSYQLSQFRNHTDTLTWDNPFLAVVPGSTRGQLALAPDNKMHQITGSVAYDITPTLRASGDISVGRTTQDDAFLPSSTVPSLAAAAGALPVPSLDGRVKTYNSSLRLTAAPIKGLRLNASYTRDERENRTDIHSYNIVAADVFLDPQPRSNTPFSLTQNRFKLIADYRTESNLKFSLGAEQDNRERSFHEAVKTHETTVWGRVGTQILEDLALSLKVAHADRGHSTYGTAVWFGLPENPLLRKYNLASRQRDSAGLRADWTVSEKISLGLTTDYANDDYSKSVVGLQHGRNFSLGLDVAAAVSEQTQITAYAHTERISSRQAGSQAFALPDWAAFNRDRFHVLGLGLKHALIVDKLDVGADLSLSRSNSKVRVEAGTGAPLFPATKTATDTVKLYATYKLQDNLSLTGSVWYERYDADDWRLDGVLPATVQTLLAFGQQAQHHDLAALQMALRYRF